jgi:hypothetical protein
MNTARRKRLRGAGGIDKTIVMGVMERESDEAPGEVRAFTIPDTKTVTIQAAVRAHVAPGSTLMTDSATAYASMPEYVHEAVNHFQKEYVRDGFTTNQREGFWSLFKRQYRGTHHWISPKHMDA